MRLAADAQRKRTILTLRRAYLDGRLESEEFAERAALALSARTTRELRLLVRDVPHLAETVRALAFAAARIALLTALWLVRFALVLLALVARRAVSAASLAPARVDGRS